MTQAGHDATLLVPVKRPDVGWELYEGIMPESEAHRNAVKLLEALLEHWAVRSAARIVAGLAIRWVQENPRIGVDPDVAVLLPSPPVEKGSLVSVKTWLPGHEPPVLAIEVVSESNPHKDYAIAPGKYASSGTKELWIFDPLLFGSKAVDGPFRLQIYRRDPAGRFARIYAGEGPAYSPALEAWAVPTNEGRMLRIADDEAATRFWVTTEEAARAGEQAARAGEQAARAAEQAALARVAELEAELARRRG